MIILTTSESDKDYIKIEESFDKIASIGIILNHGIARWAKKDKKQF